MVVTDRFHCSVYRLPLPMWFTLAIDVTNGWNDFSYTVYVSVHISCLISDLLFDDIVCWYQSCRFYYKNQICAARLCLLRIHIFCDHDDVRKWNFFRVTGHLCGEFTGQRRILDTKVSDAELWNFLDLSPNKRLSKQSWGRWFETPSRLLWRQCYAFSHWSHWGRDKMAGIFQTTFPNARFLWNIIKFVKLERLYVTWHLWSSFVTEYNPSGDPNYCVEEWWDGYPVANGRFLAQVDCIVHGISKV